MTVNKNDRKKLQDTYRFTIEAIRTQGTYQFHLAEGRKMRWHGVPMDALTRDDLMALIHSLRNRLPK